MHSGIAGLAHVLAEVRLDRPWTDEEAALADRIGARLRSRAVDTVDYDYFDGLVSDIGAFVALGQEGAAAAVERLAALVEPDGWPHSLDTPAHVLPGSRLNDATLGTAGVVLGALWADRQGTAGAEDVLRAAADVLLAEGEEAEEGLMWRVMPSRFLTQPLREMPNWSHGQAGIIASLALAGESLGRADLVDAARLGAEHLVRLGTVNGDRFAVPHVLIPPDSDLTSDEEEFAWGWCHGPSGTSRAFAALVRAGVGEVAGESPTVWRQRCLEAVRHSGIPARLRPGFWASDGRCCGTAGVGSIFLEAYRWSGDDADLDFALTLAGAVVERADGSGKHAWWRFVEHRRPDPLLPPGVGWMQGAAGIAAFLMQTARVGRDGKQATQVPRMDSFWALEEAS